MKIRRGVVTCVAALATLAAGCGGDDEGGGGGERRRQRRRDDHRLEQRVPARPADCTEAILADFTEKTGIKTKLVPLPEDQLATLITNAAAAGKLPDVMIATPRRSRTLRGAGALRRRGGAGGRRQARARHVLAEGARPRQPRRRRDRRAERRLGPAAALPQGPVRQGGARGAGVAGGHQGGGGEAQRRRPGRHHARHRAGRRVHRRDFRARGARDGLPARRRRGQRDARLAGVHRRPHLLRRPREQLLRQGNQDVESTRGTYFAGPRGDDVLVAVPARRHGRACATTRGPPARSARRTPHSWPRTAVSSARFSRPGGEPSQFGNVSTFNITVDANTEAAKQLVEFMMNDGYIGWLGLSPQGKYPVRPATRGPGEVRDGMGGARERRRPQGAAERLLLRGVDRIARRGRPELPALGLRAGPGRAGRRAGRRAADRRGGVKVIGGDDPARPPRGAGDDRGDPDGDRVGAAVASRSPSGHRRPGAARGTPARGATRAPAWRSCRRRSSSWS